MNSETRKVTCTQCEKIFPRMNTGDCMGCDKLFCDVCLLTHEDDCLESIEFYKALDTEREYWRIHHQSRN